MKQCPQELFFSGKGSLRKLGQPSISILISKHKNSAQHCNQRCWFEERFKGSLFWFSYFMPNNRTLTKWLNSSNGSSLGSSACRGYLCWHSEEREEAEEHHFSAKVFMAGLLLSFAGWHQDGWQWSRRQQEALFVCLCVDKQRRKIAWSEQEQWENKQGTASVTAVIKIQIPSLLGILLKYMKYTQK